MEIEEIIDHYIQRPIMTSPVPAFFDFESDFIEKNIRCIPMLVRFKLDACRIKLKLSEWSRMTPAERQKLATMSVDSAHDCDRYRSFLIDLISARTGGEATVLGSHDLDTSWSDTTSIPKYLIEKTESMNADLSPDKWRNLNTLQRFALTKLALSKHENKNLAKALKEFGVL